MEDFDYQYFTDKIKMNDFPIERLLTILKFSIETLLEKIKHVVTEKHEFEFGHKYRNDLR